MKIALLGDALIRQSAGVHYYALSLFEKLVASFSNHEFILIVPKPFGLLDGVKEIVVPIKTSIPFHQRIRQFIDIPRVIKANDIDIAIEPAHFGPFNLPGHIKRVTVVHDLTAIKFPQYHKVLDVLMHKLLMKRIMLNADCIIVNSNTTAADVLDYLLSVQDKLVKLNPGVIKTETSNTFKASDIGVNDKFVLTVGTIEPRKNHLSLFRAFNKLLKSRPEIDLVVVGASGWKNEMAFNYIRDNRLEEKIIFTGYLKRDQLMKLYEECEVFAYPSFYEGLGLPVLEAMSFGKALLLSDTPSLRELAGEQAVFVDPNDVDSIFDGLIKLLRNQDGFKSLQRFIKIEESTNNEVQNLGIRLGL